ncbi:MAG: signal peptidase II [Patescibacteria group bacterium]|nr:signal peptidase II [Patescibacteria group bacterium]
MFRYFFVIALLFLLDRTTKTLIFLSPADISEKTQGFFSLVLNKNIAFSLPLDYFLLYPLIFLILFFLLWQWRKSQQAKSYLIWPWGLIIIGALSNLLDRWRYGGVIDFINLKLPFASVFNLADLYISVAVVWIIWYLWFYRPAGDLASGPADKDKEEDNFDSDKKA